MSIPARDIFRRVREIQVRTGRQVADVLAGHYVSVVRGSGIEFDEVRPYLPGDEVRSIDWNVTARMGQPYVKRFVEERQLTMMLMADVSASQEFGSGRRSKREVAAELCALLAFSATLNNDKVGLALFHGEVEQYIPPRRGQKHSLRVVREVLSHRPQNTPKAGQRKRFRWLPFGQRRSWWKTGRQATSIAGAMEFLQSVCRRRAVCFVVSDFFDDDYLRSLQMASRRHDVIAVLITDPREMELPDVGLMNLLDPETGAEIQCDTASSEFRRAYRQQSEARITDLEQSFRKAKIDFVQISTDSSIVDPLKDFFRMREQRRQR